MMDMHPLAKDILRRCARTSVNVQAIFDEFSFNPRFVARTMNSLVTSGLVTITPPEGFAISIYGTEAGRAVLDIIEKIDGPKLCRQGDPILGKPCEEMLGHEGPHRFTLAPRADLDAAMIMSRVEVRLKASAELYAVRTNDPGAWDWLTKAAVEYVRAKDKIDGR